MMGLIRCGAEDGATKRLTRPKRSAINDWIRKQSQEEEDGDKMKICKDRDERESMR